ncbi:MAG: ribosome-associated translation inhibitor RaiA [Deltaproteobacteria bacterium]|nr:ribosome-associated translation inhibitor RaiA [Deltaproteobacteria bacterium]
MSLHLNFRNIESTDAIKQHIEDKVDKFKKFVTYPMEIHVILSVEKTLHCVEITCHAEHKDFIATSKSKNLYESIDVCSHKIEAQLKKEREKKKGHNSAHKIASRHAEKLGADIKAIFPHLGKGQQGRRTGTDQD